MATSKEYKDLCLERLSLLDNIRARAMMGEYLLYYNDILFGGIYDEKLLVKKTKGNEKYNLKEAIPYKNAKPMYFVEDGESKEQIKSIIIDTYRDLPNKKKKENS